MRPINLVSGTILLAASLALLPATSIAASSGGGGGSSNSMPTPSPKNMKCKKGEVVRTVTMNGMKKKKCVKATAGIIPADEMYEQGNALALGGDYDWALEVLALADQNDPRVLNMQGYSHRKSGRLDVAVSYYKQALAMNPNSGRAREYLGVVLRRAARYSSGKAQLAEIGKRCGMTCEEYMDLSKAISAASN